MVEYEIPDDLYRRLTQYALNSGKSTDEIVREAILSHLRELNESARNEPA
jgi:predicted DNA-binding protein